MTVKIHPRSDWQARPPKSVKHIATPTRELWLHHTVTASTGDIAGIIRQIQNFHMDSKGWSDIAYSFLVDIHGGIWEGRGAGIAGGHTKDHNQISHAISAIGNFDATNPPQAMLNSIAALTAHGHAQGWWPAQITGGHRQASGASTACPGRHLMAALPAINRAALTPTKPAPTEPPPKLPQEDDMARAYRIPNGEVWLCTGTHREHINETTLNERAVMGLVAPVPADAKDRDDKYPQWVRKTNTQGEKILRKLKA